MASSYPVIDDFAKDCPLGRLKGIREALVWKLDGLSDYDIRRPLTATGTNLLGLVKHMATLEAWYFGEVFGRAFPETLGRWQDADGSDLWVTAGETRDEIIAFYQRVWRHTDATIQEGRRLASCRSVRHTWRGGDCAMRSLDLADGRP